MRGRCPQPPTKGNAFGIQFRVKGIIPLRGVEWSSTKKKPFKKQPIGCALLPQSGQRRRRNIGAIKACFLKGYLMQGLPPLHPDKKLSFLTSYWLPIWRIVPIPKDRKSRSSGTLGGDEDGFVISVNHKPCLALVRLFHVLALTVVHGYFIPVPTI